MNEGGGKQTGYHLLRLCVLRLSSYRTGTNIPFPCYYGTFSLFAK
jgi:hypothetical protein